MTRLLFVDDEQETRAEFGDFLAQKGYRVFIAENGVKAFQLFHAEEPDIVVTDYDMPGINGIELLKELKGSKPEIPVIMISGRADMRTAVQALKDDAFDFLEKPVNSKALLASIERALQRKRNAENPVEEFEDSGSKRYYGPLNHQLTGSIKNVSAIYIYRSLDEYARKHLSDAFRKLLVGDILNKRVLIFLNNVTYINNVGLNLLIEMHEELTRRGHTVYATQPSEMVYKYMKTLGYVDYFNLIVNPHEALETLELRN